MRNKANKRLLILNYILASFALLFLFFLLPSFALWFKLATCGLVVVSQILASLFYAWKLDALFRLVQSFSIFVFAGFYLFSVLEYYGIFERISDPDSLREIIRKTGIWGPLIFVGLQIIQVVFLPIPSVILDLVGLAMFGSLKAFLLTTTGVVVGSMIAFTLGKLFGKKLAVWIAGEKDAEKYRRLIAKRGFSVLVFMFLFPFFPDDLLCILAGLTAITYGQFFLLIILTRPVSIAFVSFFGTGDIIPFHGWGIAVWAVFFIILITAFVLLNIYQKQASILAKRLFKKKKRKANQRVFQTQLKNQSANPKSEHKYKSKATPKIEQKKPKTN